MTSDISYIYLEDGTVLTGEGFGSKAMKSGELVFTTSMNGYPETLTDPSYSGQILIITHPLVGNYGVPKKEYASEKILSNFESENIHINGLIVSELTKSSKWNGKLNLDRWLDSEGVPGISGIDTRMLTKRIRDQGVTMCVMSTREIKDPKKAIGEDYAEINFVEKVSPKKPIIQSYGKKNVVVVDCGVKHGILKSISKLGYNVIRVPYDYTTDKIMGFDPVGVVYSNGPGNPNMLKPVVTSMQGVLEYKLPVFGICLGHQIACMALGGKVRKMKFGHRAVNKAAVDSISKKAYITSHNHGYALLPEDVPKEGKIWFMSPDDNVVEGMIYKDRNMITTQFHPEGRPGTNDAGFVFGMFDNMIKKGNVSV